MPAPNPLDNVVTIPTSLLGRTIGLLRFDQERVLADAMVLAHDLELSVLDG